MRGSPFVIGQLIYIIMFLKLLVLLRRGSHGDFVRVADHFVMVGQNILKCLFDSNIIIALNS